MKVLTVLTSCVIFFVGMKVYKNKKWKNELFLSLQEMNNRLQECMEDPVECELVNELPQSRSPSLELITDTSNGSYTLVNEKY